MRLWRDIKSAPKEKLVWVYLPPDCEFDEGVQGSAYLDGNRWVDGFRSATLPGVPTHWTEILPDPQD